ncbi:MAG TPA: C45 family peptidase [Candidatus Desulfaltia sp.]|nr:C45 family peptidase [Candidatus Desulfaltia sp.]
MESPYPMVSVEGSAYECGLQHGEAAREQVRANVGYYLGYWQRNLRLDKEDAERRGSELADTVKRFNPALLDEVRGVADGSEVTVETVLALNGRYELAWANPAQLMGGCTSIGAVPTATRFGDTLLAQNWDYRLGVRDTCIVLEVKRDGAPAVVMHTEAGIIGHKGMNSAGLGLALNAMVSDRDRLGDSAPFFLVCREMLGRDNLSEAMKVFLNTDRTVSYNVMLGCEGVVLDLEAHPGGTDILLPEAGVLAHTNHFMGPRAVTVHDEYLKADPSAVHRYMVAREGLIRGAGGHSPESFMEVLRSHVGYPGSVCFHQDPRKEPDQREETLTSVVMDLEDRALWLTKGPPCGGSYTRLDFPSLLVPS